MSDLLFAISSGSNSRKAVVADVTLGQPLTFPNLFIGDQPKDVDIFILDPPSELSTSALDASGSVTFHELPCAGATGVDFSIDAVLGSELHNEPSVRVTGTFGGPINEPPG